MWGLVDCDNFFCSCERVFRPDLLGRPVVVLSNNDGCVVARSAEVRAMGVPMGMPYYQLVEKYPRSGITAFSSNYSLYGDMSARVMAILRDEAPDVVQYSIDEAFVDLQGMRIDKIKDWGEKVASKIHRWTGIPVSIGIAPTMTMAKAASHFAKKYPGYRKCCAILDSRQREKALALLGIGDIWGIGRRTAVSLRSRGVLTALDFANRQQSWVRRHYHVTGERIWHELRGEPALSIDDMEGHTRRSIITSRSFPEMLSDIESIRTHISNFAARCAVKLRRQHTVCGEIMVFVQSNRFREDLDCYNGSATYRFTTSTASTTELVTASSEVLNNIFRPGIKYKRAGVMVTDIIPAEAVQPDLFEYDPERSAKYRSLSSVLDEINSRLGADTVILASQQYPQCDASGRHLRFAQSIRRSFKSPDYSLRPDAFKVT